MFNTPKVQLFADLFQSSYKHKYRFFAGVILFARIGILMVWNLVGSRAAGFAVLAALCLGILLLHSLLQPNIKNWINVLDTLIYSHMTAITLLAVYINLTQVAMTLTWLLFSHCTWWVYLFQLYTLSCTWGESFFSTANWKYAKEEPCTLVVANMMYFSMQVFEMIILYKTPYRIRVMLIYTIEVNCGGAADDPYVMCPVHAQLYRLWMYTCSKCNATWINSALLATVSN